MDQSFQLSDRWECGTVRDRNNMLSIRYGLYKPQKPITRYLVFINGRTEFIEKYSYLPEDLNIGESTGFLTWDHRGQGASGGARAYVETYDDYVFDAQQVIAHCTGGKPCDILSHSMGGLIGLHGINLEIFKPERLIMLSPLLGLDNHLIPQNLAQPISSFLTKMHLGPINSGSGRYERKKFANNRLTQDFERYQRIINTPYPVPGATFAWIDATFKAIKLAFSDKTLKAIPEETHILGPSHDQVVDPRAWQDWIKKARAMGHQTTSYELFHGARHELLAEIRSIYSRTLRKIEKILKS